MSLKCKVTFMQSALNGVQHVGVLFFKLSLHINLLSLASDDSAL